MCRSRPQVRNAGRPAPPVGWWAYGSVGLPDALALEAAIARGAKALKDLGSSEPLDVRRSWALGDLARTSGGA